MTDSPAPPSASQQLARIAAQMRLIAKQHQRHDLAGRLDSAHRILSHTGVNIVVVGQFKQGKSALVNAIVGAPVCPVDDVAATAIPTTVRFGERVEATIVTQLPGEEAPIRTRVAPEQLRRHVTEHADVGASAANVHAEVTLPRSVLREGLTIIDTPGVGRAQAQVATNLTLLPEADATLMVSDATQELTAPEITFVKQALTLCPRVSCVLSKTDLQHEWRSILATNQEHLRSAGLQLPMIPTSALLHQLATQEGDAELAAESRMGELSEFLLGHTRERVLAARRSEVAREVIAVSDHLTMVLRAELDALKHPEHRTAAVLGLREAEAVAHELTHRSAKWQQTLYDGAGELLADIEFDLRDRLRAVGREAETLIDTSDPGKVWDDIGSWLAEAITQAIAENFVWTHERSVHLAETVAEHFSLEGRAAIPEFKAVGVEEVLRAVGGLDTVSTGKLTIGQKLMIGLKGSYGGVLMFGLMTTLAGMALVNPLSIAAGLVMGGFAYRQDASTRLEQRRGEAKTAVRKLVDEAVFQVGKASRDRVNRVRRLLRDHFSGVAEELKRSLHESVARAERGAQTPANAHERRIAQLTHEATEIERLRTAAHTLMQSPTGKVLEGRTP